MDKAALRELAEKATQINSVLFDPGTFRYSILGLDSDTVKLATAANPQTILALLAEIQSLTEERTAWRTTAENAEKDAERYRFLREQDDEDFCFSVVKNPHFDVFESGQQLDAAIDAAMKEEK